MNRQQIERMIRMLSLLDRFAREDALAAIAKERGAGFANQVRDELVRREASR